MNHPEAQLQKSCVRYFRLQYPKYLIYSNANEGKRTTLLGSIMVAMGLMHGVCDVTIVLPGKTVWVEFKAPGGKLTNYQRDFMAKVIALDHAAHVCYTVEDFMDILKTHIR